MKWHSLASKSKDTPTIFLSRYYKGKEKEKEMPHHHHQYIYMTMMMMVYGICPWS